MILNPTEQMPFPVLLLICLSNSKRSHHWEDYEVREGKWPADNEIALCITQELYCRGCYHADVFQRPPRMTISCIESHKSFIVKYFRLWPKPVLLTFPRLKHYSSCTCRCSFCTCATVASRSIRTVALAGLSHSALRNQ